MGTTRYTYSAEALLSGKTGQFGSDSGLVLSTADGLYGNITNLESVDSNGFFTEISTVVTLYTSMDEVVNSLDSISNQQMSIMVETYPYNYTRFDQSNEVITLYSAGYNGLTDPITSMSEPESEYQIGNYYVVNYDSSEISGLRDRFGYQTGSSLVEKIESEANSIAQIGRAHV